MPTNSTYFNICINDRSNQIVANNGVVIEGQMLRIGTAIPDKLVRLKDKSLIDEMFGQGSIIGESLKIAFEEPTSVDIYALPRMDVKNGVKAQYTLTFRGSATRNEPLRIFAGNKPYEIMVDIYKGEDASSIAKKVAEFVLPTFPFDVEYKDNKVIFTAKNAGEVGNVLCPLKEWEQFMGVYNTGVAVNLTHDIIGSNDPVYDYGNIFGDCSYYAHILCSPNITWQYNLQKYLEAKWDCTKGAFRGGHGYVYNVGDLQTILETGTNAAVLSRLACHKDSHVFPYLKNTSFGILSANQGQSLQTVPIAVEGDNYGVLTAISSPTNCSGLWSQADIEKLTDEGFVVAEPNTYSGSGYASPVVRRDITNFLRDETGSGNYTYRMASTSRILFELVNIIEDFLTPKIATPVYTNGTTIPINTQGTTPAMLQGELIAYLRTYTGRLLSNITFDNVEDNIRVIMEQDINGLCKGDPDKVIIFLRLYLPNNIDKFEINIDPRLNRCGRGV